MTTIEDLITRSQIQYIIGYLEGVAFAANDKVHDALQKPIIMLKVLIGEKTEE